jgi:hypothetical protein
MFNEYNYRHNIRGKIEIGKIKNPTSQDESGVLFQMSHVEPPLRVKGAGAELIVFSIQGMFGDVKREKGSGFKVQGSEVKLLDLFIFPCS